MHGKALRHIIKQHFTALEKGVAEINKDFDKDAIHAFRVQVKKLRAFLRLAKLKLPKKVKKVYAAAGQIRDLQIMLKQIRKASAGGTEPAAYLLLLEEQLQKRKTFFSSLSEENHFGKARRKLCKKLPSHLPFHTISDYLHNEITAMLLLTSIGFNSDDELHSTRKKIKNILFINEMYQEELEQHHQPVILDETSRKKAAALADDLGKFVDKWVALSLLHPDNLKKISPEERKQLQSIRQRWQTQKRSLRRNVISSLLSSRFRRALK